jgi:hypothetical protein
MHKQTPIQTDKPTPQTQATKQADKQINQDNQPTNTHKTKKTTTTSPSCSSSSLLHNQKKDPCETMDNENERNSKGKHRKITIREKNNPNKEKEWQMCGVCC